MKKENIEKLYNLFWIFIFGCVAGWIIEGIFTFVRYGALINHCALVLGPFNVAYGFGACLLSILLAKYKDDNYFKIFSKCNIYKYNRRKKHKIIFAYCSSTA